MRPPCVVVQRVLGEDAVWVSLAEDQHPVGDLGADSQYESLGKAVRPRTPGRDLDHLDARVGQHPVKRGRELSGPIANQESEPPNTLTEVHHERNWTPLTAAGDHS